MRDTNKQTDKRTNEQNKQTNKQTNKNKTKQKLSLGAHKKEIRPIYELGRGAHMGVGAYQGRGLSTVYYVIILHYVTLYYVILHYTLR